MLRSRPHGEPSGPWAWSERASYRARTRRTRSLLQQLLVKAHAYLRSYRWCHGIQESYFGLGVAGVVGVFLLRIVGGEGVDDWLWVVVGDLPSCHLVTDDAPDGVSRARGVLRTDGRLDRVGPRRVRR